MGPAAAGAAPGQRPFRDQASLLPGAERPGQLRIRIEKSLRILPGPTPALDETAIYDFLTYRYIPTPKTIYRDIRKLEPGHYAVVKDGRLTVHQYWDVTFSGNSKIDEVEAVRQVRDKLQEAVDLHLIADVPVGVMLSGGLDSSSLTALAAASTQGRLRTFSIGFDVETHDETAFANMVVERYGTEHREFRVERKMAIAAERDLVSVYDEPFGDGSAIPCLYVSELARRESRSCSRAKAATSCSADTTGTAGRFEHGARARHAGGSEASRVWCRGASCCRAASRDSGRPAWPRSTRSNGTSR